MLKKILSILALSSAVMIAGCNTAQVAKFQQISANFQTVVAQINTDIALTAPLVAKYCGDLQSVEMLLQPYIPTNAKAPQYFAAANGALISYCQSPPTNINSTVAALAAAVNAANAGYSKAVGR